MSTPRRRFWLGRWGRAAVVVPLIFTAAVTTLGDEATAVDERPNIILILTDDQRWDTLEWMPTVTGTLMSEGITFTNGYVTTPLCCPSRASILTGQYVHNHGVKSGGGGPDFDDASTIATWLLDAGYRTALVGKYLNGYQTFSPYVPPGWEAWQAFVQPAYYDYEINDNGNHVAYGSDAVDYSTDVLAEKAVEFVDAYDGRPFFLLFTPFAPHQPFLAAPRHEGAMSGMAPWRPPSFNELDVTDKPSWIQNLDFVDEAVRDDRNQKQVEMLLAVDDAVAALLEALDRVGQRDNTMIVFTSDNGMSWGEHRWEHKFCGYEECVRVPFVVWYPNGNYASGTVDEFVLNIDLAPTFAELAATVPTSPVDGVSLVPILENPSSNVRANFLIEYWGVQTGPPTWFGARHGQWSYIELASGERELYDLAADPYQLVNVAGDPTYSVVERLIETRLQTLKEAGTGVAALVIDPAPAPSATVGEPYSHTMEATGGSGAVGWALGIGTLPDGLSLDEATGEIAGSPAGEGTWQFTVIATDERDQFDVAARSIDVAASTTIDTVTPVGAIYEPSTSTLRVAAASSLGSECTLTASRSSDGHVYGEMVWRDDKGWHGLYRVGVDDPLGEVTVMSSGGGSATVIVSYQ